MVEIRQRTNYIEIQISQNPVALPSLSTTTGKTRWIWSMYLRQRIGVNSLQNWEIPAKRYQRKISEVLREYHTHTHTDTGPGFWGGFYATLNNGSVVRDIIV